MAFSRIPAPPALVAARPHAGYAEFLVPGDVEIAALPGICSRLVDVVAVGARYVVLDMSQADYCSVAAARALVIAQRRARDRDGLLVSIRCSPAVRRAFQVAAMVDGADDRSPAECGLVGRFQRRYRPERPRDAAHRCQTPVRAGESAANTDTDTAAAAASD